jgi:hypothetical protein
MPNPSTHLLAKTRYITTPEFKGVWEVVRGISNACCTVSLVVPKIQLENHMEHLIHSTNIY